MPISPEVGSLTSALARATRLVGSDAPEVRRLRIELASVRIVEFIDRAAQAAPEGLTDEQVARITKSLIRAARGRVVA